VIRRAYHLLRSASCTSCSACTWCQSCEGVNFVIYLQAVLLCISQVSKQTLKQLK